MERKLVLKQERELEQDNERNDTIKEFSKDIIKKVVVDVIDYFSLDEREGGDQRGFLGARSSRGMPTGRRSALQQ